MDLKHETRWAMLVAVGLGAATLLTFWPLTGCDFINYDDTAYVTENAHVLAGLSLANAGWAFRTTCLGNWHPLTVLSHMLDVQFFGLNPAWHHFTSLCLHVANTLLLFWVLRRMTGRLWPSACVAALFALHPLHVESVAWISERKDVLSTFFGLLCLWGYGRYAEVQSLKSSQRYLKFSTDETLFKCNKVRDVFHSFRAVESKVQSQEPEVRSQHHVSRITDHSSRFAFHASRIYLPSSIFYLLSLSCFALSLLSKAMFVTLPAVMLLLDYWPLQRLCLAPGSGESLGVKRRLSNLVAQICNLLYRGFAIRRALEPAPTPAGHKPAIRQIENLRYEPRVAAQRLPLSLLVLEKLPFFVFSITATWVSVLLLSGTGATREAVEVGLGGRLARAFAACQHYLVKMFWPFNLAMPYLRPAQWPLAEIVSAVIVVVALALGAVWQGRRRPYLLVGWFWFLGTLIPVIGLVPVGAHAMADRYTYFPLIGLFLALAWSAAENAGRWRRGRVALAAAASAVLLACVLTTGAQVRCWRDSETLFRHAIAVTRGNYIAHGGLGLYLFKQGKVDEAIRHYETALWINPLYDVAHSNLGRALADQKRYDEAVAHFETGLSLRPDDAKTRNNFGSVLLLQGRYEEAMRQFEEVVRLQPDHAPAHNNLAISCRKLGRIGDAITHYQEATRLQPDSPEALTNLAWLLAAYPDARFRNGKEAVELATRACELSKYQNPIPLATLAAAYAETGRFQEAVSFAERALEASQRAPGALADRLSAMLEAFRAGRAYHAD